jgi:hypothetical protein
VTDAGSADFLGITSGGRLEVITNSGGIRINGLDGRPSGTLELDASQIYVTDAALNARLVSDPDFTGRTEALRTNNGPVRPEGYLVAGSIELEASGDTAAAGERGRIYIQNTGTATEFAGLTVGAGGLSVLSEDFDESATPEIDLVGFGRRDRGDGIFTTGRAFFDEVEFNTTPRTRKKARQVILPLRSSTASRWALPRRPRLLALAHSRALLRSIPPKSTSCAARIRTRSP